MLKQVILSRRIAKKRAELEPLLQKRADLKAKRDELASEEEKLEEALNEITEETEQTVQEEIETATEELVSQVDEVEAQQAETEGEITDLEAEIEQLQGELDELSAKVNGEPEEPAEEPEEEEEARKQVERKKGDKIMIRNKFFGLTSEQTRSFFADEKVKGFLNEVRSAIREKRSLANAGLLIPDNMLGLVREEVARVSKLLPYVNLRHVTGTGRMNIMAKIPEAVWTEMCARINEIDLTFNQAEVDGYKVGAAVVVCNAIIEDSDIDLAAEIVSAIGIAIAKALDKAILFGTGTKTPIGIATRLAASSQPAWWGTNEPSFTDLHSSNVLTINQQSASGAAFFMALIEKLAVAKPKYSSDGLFWAMNRKTHLDIMAKALAFDSAAALVSNTELFPVVGGAIVEMEDDELADYEIIGGFGGNYLLAERAGLELASSKEYKFLEDQTVFKGTARYDGRPLCGEAFVIVNYNNTSPTTTKSFPIDYANADLNTLTLVAAVGGSSGKTVVTASDTIDTASPVLKYKVGKVDVNVGDALPSGFETLTSGTTAITAAAGKIITVVELDSGSKIVSAGYVASVPKA